MHKILYISFILVVCCFSGYQGIVDEMPSPDIPVQTISKTNNIYDMTELDEKVVYMAVSDLIENPELYLGRTIRISGPCVSQCVNNKTYHTVMFSNETDCSQLGVEFALKDDADYPEDYTTITVTGTFSSYQENGETYYHLSDAEYNLDF